MDPIRKDYSVQSISYASRTRAGLLSCQSFFQKPKVLQKLKEIIWKILVKILGLLPVAFRRLLCRLSFAVSTKKRPISGIRELISLHEDLMWHVNQAAIRYEKGIHPKHRLMDYHRFFIERLKRSDRVLDVGCGYGAVSFSMAQAGALVTGVDIDEKNIPMARERYKHINLDFVHGDVTRDLPNGVFDVIVMSNVLEHIEDRIGLLKMIQDKFQPKLWLIRVPMINRDWLVPLKKELGMPYFSDPTHYTEYTLKRVLRMK